jgi:hypothetical protein
MSKSISASAALWSLAVVGVMAAGCSNDDSGGEPSSTPAADSSAGAAALSPVFPDHLAKAFREEVTAPIPGGGTAAVGRICRGGGADVFYVGVKGATGLPDGVHAVNVDKIDETIRFETGAPDSGVGAGAAQSAFREPEYTFTFEGLDVVITIAGCGQ